MIISGSGPEIVHTQQLCRTFLSCEIDPVYHKMIVERLEKNGTIGNAHRIDMRDEHSHSWEILQQRQLIDGLVPKQLQLSTHTGD